MLDHAINSAIDSASPVINKWRVIFLFLALILISPKLDTLIIPPVLFTDIESSAVTISDAILSNQTLKTIIYILIYLVMLPYAHYYLIRYFASLNVGYADDLIQKVQRIYDMPEEDISELIDSSYDELSEKADHSLIDINRKKTFSESILLIFSSYLLVQLEHNHFDLMSTSILLVIAMFCVFYESRIILKIYLTDIALFNALNKTIQKHLPSM